MLNNSTMLVMRHRMARGWWLLASLGLFATLSDALLKSPPLMVKQPNSNEEQLFQVATGQDENDKPFIIECEANGEPAPMYRWTKNGFPFDWQIYDDRISQQPGRGTLVITQPKNEDSGQYQCYAHNELGVATSNSVFVRKSILNSFKHEDPFTMTITEGDPASLPCQPPDGYPKPSVYWHIQEDSGSLRSINSTRMTVDPEGTLWFSNVSRKDNSYDFTYACSTTSRFRNEYNLGSRIFLKVLEVGNSVNQIKNEPKPQFISRKNIVILKGREIKLWCIYSGTPLPQIKWTKKNGMIPSGRVDYANYGKTLVIKLADFEDAGTYECEATNGVGSAKSHSMNVDVQAVPYFTKEPTIQNKAEDETAVFECDASGKPEPEIRWIYNGRPIEEVPSKANRQIHSNKIIISNLTKQDTGNYGCNATNAHGYVYKDVYVNVLVPLGAPINFKLVAIKDATTARLSWESGSKDSVRGHFTGYKIQTWTDADGGVGKARDIIVENNEPSVVVDSFVPNMVNYVRVLVFNGAHDGPTSDTIELDMPEGIPGPIDSLEALPLGSSGFLLMWQKPKRENGVLTGYHIFYQEVEGTNLGPKSERIPPITEPATTRAKLAQLKPGTKYRLTVKARTRAGIGSPFFIERTTRSGPPEPPGRPSFIWLYVTNKTLEQALKITWLPNDSNPGAHFFVQYKRYGESIYEDSPHELNEDFIILEGLEPSETYEIRVVSVDGDYLTPSDVKKIVPVTPSSAPYLPNDNFATKGLVIWIDVAIAFLFIII